MNRYKKSATRLLLRFGIFMLLAYPVHADWLRDERTLMGTQVTVELWSASEATGRRAMEAVFAEVHRLDVMMNPFNEASELARINREAGRKSVTTTSEIITVVQRALYYSRISDGAFDISFASIGQYYDYRAAKAPDASRLKKDKGNIDFQSISIDPKSLTIRFGKPGMKVDLGGIAKGYAVDRGVEILLAAGISSAVVSAGGDSRILGDMGDRPRTVGIRHPRKPEEYVVLMPLTDTAISTSGDYERFFIAGGERFHHILDPTTGRSAAEVQSASILAARAIDSDALSTTAFVLGVEKGLMLINSLSGVDGIIIDGQGKLHYSDGLLLNSPATPATPATPTTATH